MFSRQRNELPGGDTVDLRQTAADPEAADAIFLAEAVALDGEGKGRPANLRAAIPDELDLNRLAWPQADGAVDILERIGLTPGDCDNPIAGLEPGFGCRAFLDNIADLRRGARNAVGGEERREYGDREQEVGERTGEDDEEALPRRARVERAPLALLRIGRIVGQRVGSVSPMNLT